ncbi:MAG: tRNA (guanosine(37)-N1)-methyltransferase TrmD [Bacteriovoracaceae bacterium]
MKKRIWILTLFPEFFEPLLKCGIAGQALRGERSEENFSFEVHTINIRDYSKTKYRSVDDTPYGGGPGMVMRADILRDALIEGVMARGGYSDLSELHVVFPSPRGRVLTNKVARELATGPLSDPGKDVVFICGRYEGVDERFLEKYVQDYISLGDFVLTGGELAVMTILDASVRFVPGILGNKLSSEADSFEDGLIEFPQYTKPREFEEMNVPDILLEGHHKKIGEWQLEEKIRMTKKYRPDLYEKYNKT